MPYKTRRCEKCQVKFQPNNSNKRLCDLCRLKARKECAREYRKTEAYRESQLQRRQTEAWKEYHRQYLREYRKTEAYREKRRNYRHSEAYKQYLQKRMQTEAAKKISRAASAKFDARRARERVALELKIIQTYLKEKLDER